MNTKNKMPFKKGKPKSGLNRNWTHRIAIKHSHKDYFGDLFEIGLNTSGANDNASREECLKGDISLEEYSKKREKELIKYKLSCSCDNLAGGIIDDQGAMNIAHVALTLDFLDSMAKWKKIDEAEQKLVVHFQAQTNHRGWAVFDFVRWEKVKNDKAFFGKMVNEAREELLAFEALNGGLFCDMTTGKTPEEKQRWRNLKLVRL